MKICPKCNQEKEESEFYHTTNRPSGSAFCKECFNKYCMDRWIQKRIDAVNYLGSKCNDCGISYPDYPIAVFDFHHLNPSEKEADWNKLRLKSPDKIIKELDKCVLLCANCHRIRHSIQNKGGAESPLPYPK